MAFVNKGLFIHPETGNVGIGTHISRSKLDIYGTALFSGNVGIGTTNPTTNLYIFSGATQDINGNTPSAIHLVPKSGTNGTTTGITWGVANGGGIETGAQAGILVNGKLNYGSTMSLLTTDNFIVGSKERVTILPNGNVGIGTTLPTANLDVLGNVNVNGNIGNGTYIYDAYTKATNYTNLNGTHTSDANTGSWHRYLHFSENDGRIGNIYNASSDETIATEWVEYAVPSGMKQGWLSHLPWSTCRYFDIYGKYADGTLIWLFRVNAYNANSTSYNSLDWSGVTIVPICAVDRFSHIRIVGGRGRYHLMGFAWSKHDRQHNNGGQTGLVHIDNIIGPGTIVQVQHVQTSATRIAITTQDISAISGLSISFTPRFANSKILLQAMINSDGRHVSTFGFLKNGGYIISNTNTNSQGSISTTYYGNDANSYMFNVYISYMDTATSTSAITYDAAISASWAGTVRTTYVNDRDSNDMRSISTMTIFEIRV